MTSFPQFLERLRERRQAFIAAGATSSDHGHPTAATLALSPAHAAALFNKALTGKADRRDAERFRAHMLVEFARMSVDDGLVMQLHPGAVRNHNTRPVRRGTAATSAATSPRRRNTCAR